MTKITPEHDKALLAAIAEKKEKLWLKGNLYWKLHSGQKMIYDTIEALPHTTRKRVVECSRGYGKSYLNAVLSIETALRNKSEFPVRIIGPELKQTVEIVTPLIEKIIADAPPGLVTRKKSENKWKVGNSELVIGGFNRDYINKLRGQRACRIFLEEARDVPSDDYRYGLNDVLSPMLLHAANAGLKGDLIIFTTSPREQDHWFLLDTVPEAQLLGAYFTYTIYDNPLYSEEQIAIAIKESGGVDSETFRREYMCEHFRSTELAAVPQFDKSRHVRESGKPSHAHYLLSVDFGGTQDKTVSLLMYMDYVRSRLVVVDERVFDSGTPTTEIVAATLELEKQAQWREPDRIFDAPGQTLVDLNNLHNYSGRIPIKDLFEAQINNLQVAFYNDQIEIHPRCKFLITTLENGRLNKNRNDYARTATLGHCDAIAALSYGWRNVKRDSPFPIAPINHETHWEHPARAQSNEMQKLARALVPRQIRSR